MNRKKHKLHSSKKNLDVIERCTNMWWNPINAIRHKEQQKILKRREVLEARKRKRDELILEKKLAREAEKKAAKAAARQAQIAASRKREIWKRDRQHQLEQARVWAQEKWRFSCICKETCSYYENPMYHPTGPQFQCEGCKIWSHVECVFGNIKESELKELDVSVICG